MSVLKKSAGIVLSVILAASVTVLPANVSAATKDITLKRFGGYTYSIEREPGYSYSYKVSSNSGKNIKVTDSFPYGDYVVYIAAKNKTGATLSTVKIKKTNEATGVKTTIDKINVKVTSNSKQTFKKIKISKGVEKKVAVKCKISDEYSSNSAPYKLKIKNTKIAKFVRSEKVSGTDYCYCYITGKKKGSTSADVYAAGTKVKLGKVKIKVGSYKAKIDPLYKDLKLKYNSHGSVENYYWENNPAVVNQKTDAKYSYKISKKIATIKSKRIYPKKTGKAKVTVYQKLKGKKKTKVGKFNLQVIKGTMAEVFRNNKNGDSDADFLNYDNWMHLSEGETSFNLAKLIDKIVLNNKSKGTSFSKNDYSITYTRSDSDVAIVDSLGAVHAIITPDQMIARNNQESIEIGFKIKFSDNSTYSDVFYLGID